jgi:hypothetical protein
MAWVAEAQYLYDVGKQPITSAQVSALRMRQNVLRTLDVTATNALVIALDTADARNTSVILRNEETGRNVALSGFAAGSREVTLPPLLLAELKVGTLGVANFYSCTVLETASNGVATVKSQAGFVMPSHENKLPVFNYGPTGAVKSTAISERSLVGVGKAKPHFLLASYDDPALVAKAARMEEEGAYYVYTYQLPDGSLSTYDEVPQSVSLAATTTGSLGFEVSASGSTTAQNTANTFTTALWGSVLSGPVPVTVSITFSDLGVGNENVIGQSWEPAVYRSGSIYYPSALRNQKAGYDINKQMSDIRLEFNTRYTFYYGTNGVCPSGQIDYVSVLLHEICHGLGFYATIAPDTGVYENGPSSPFIFDTLLFYRGTRVTKLSSTVRAASLISDALYWDGTNAVKANNGNRIKIYAPTTYQSGSSGSHWDDDITFSTFMKHAYHGVVHTFSSRKLGAMKDLGWTLVSDTVTPAAPASVAASDDLADKVRVTWSVCTNATFYRIYRYTSNTSGSASQIGTSTTTSYDDLTATADVLYYYWVKAANGTGTSDFGKSDTGLRMSPATAMATALDTTNLDWTTGGDANWYLQSTVTHDGVDAARSGLIGDGQTSWLRTTVTGPGTIGFWTRVSSQLPMFGSDLLTFKIDGIASDIVLGGEVDWTYYTMPVFAGDHELAWEYSKDGSGKAGSDCAWVDEVTFTPVQAFGFAIQDGLLTATNELFSMRAIAANNTVVIWDTSTNLVQWVPWWTNTLTNGSFDMQAPIGTNAQQFFRLRLP